MRILLLCLLCFVVQAAPTTNVKVTLRCQFGAHADFFVWYVGGESDVYTNSACSTVPQTTIMLAPNQTYYFRVSAFVRAKETDKSAQVGVHVNTTTITTPPGP